MKKIFTLIAAAIMAVAANAEVSDTIRFSEAASAGSLNGQTFTAGNLSMTVTDTNTKVSVDASSAYFGTSAEDKSIFGYRLKTGGKSGLGNMLTFNAKQAGKFIICARTGSNSATDRNVIVTQNETELVKHIMLESECVSESYKNDQGEDLTRKIYQPVSVDVAAGDFTVTYPKGSINFYGFVLISAGSAGINNVTAASESNVAKKYMKNGQLVIETAKGTFSVAGARVK